MGVITQEMNRKKQLETTAEGVVKYIKLDKFPEPKVTTWQGKKIESTHRASVLLEKDGESVWISLGEFKSNRDNITFKVGEEWKELKQGQTVIIDIKKVGEWNGKPTYQSSKSSITILEEAPENTSGEATNNSKPQGNTTTQGSSKEAQTGSNSVKTTNGSAGSAKTFKVYGTIKSIEEGVAVVVGEDSKEVQVVLGEHSSEVSVGGRLTAQVDGEGNIKSGFKSYGAVKTDKENIGMLRCHAFNGATTLLNSEGIQINPLSILEAGKVIHDTTTKMKTWFAETEAGKAMDARELGNTVGNAVLNCASFSSRGLLEQDVKDFLTEIVPLMTDYITKPVVEHKQEIKQEVQEPIIMIDNFSSGVDIPEPDFDLDCPF